MYFIDLDEMLEYFRNINPWLVGLALGLYLLSYLIRSIRWRIVLRPVKKISIREAFTLFMSGMLVNYLIPIRAGEVAKGLFLKGLKDVPVSKSLPTIFIDKMMDLFPVLLLLLLLPFVPIQLSPAITWMLTILLVIFLLFVAVILLALFKQNSAAAFLKMWFFWLPKSLKQRVYNFLEMFIQGLDVIKHNKKNAWEIIGLSILAVIIDALYIVAMFAAFDFSIPFLIALFGYTLINLSYILPTPPAQIGSNETIYIIIFTFAFVIDKNLVSATLGFAHLLTGTVIIVVGIISTQYLGINLRKALRPGSSTE